MAKLSLTPAFIRDSLKLLKERGLKETFFGKKVALSSKEQELLDWIKNHPDAFAASGGRKGLLTKLNLMHQGKGTIYLLPNRLGDAQQESVVLFDNGVSIQPGPDLYLYLATEKDVRKNGLGEYLDLGLIKGTKGGQSYTIKQPINALARYRSAVIYCRQFSVLFTFATLA